jgi:hypothetical protein
MLIGQCIITMMKPAQVVANFCMVIIWSVIVVQAKKQNKHGGGRTHSVYKPITKFSQFT